MCEGGCHSHARLSPGRTVPNFHKLVLFRSSCLLMFVFKRAPNARDMLLAKFTGQRFL